MPFYKIKIVMNWSLDLRFYFNIKINTQTSLLIQELRKYSKKDEYFQV